MVRQTNTQKEIETAKLDAYKEYRERDRQKDIKWHNEREERDRHTERRKMT